MRHVDVQLHDVDANAYRGMLANASHVKRKLTGSCALFLPKQVHPCAVYIELDQRLPHVVAALRSIHFGKAGRTDGMYSVSRTFGYAPKQAIRGKETCHRATLAREAPEAHEAIASLAPVVEEWYRRVHGELYAQHEATVSKVLPEWRLGGGVFTSGIINRNNQLPYHFDSGNFAGCWSNMLVFKNACAGGDLVCPELDVCFTLRDHSLLMFDGQSILHGVTPFRFTRPSGWRYSIVFYSLQQMWRCDPVVDNARLHAQRRTERERARFAQVAT